MSWSSVKYTGDAEPEWFVLEIIIFKVMFLAVTNEKSSQPQVGLKCNAYRLTSAPRLIQDIKYCGRVRS